MTGGAACTSGRINGGGCIGGGIPRKESYTSLNTVIFTKCYYQVSYRSERGKLVECQGHVSGNQSKEKKKKKEKEKGKNESSLLNIFLLN